MSNLIGKQAPEFISTAVLGSGEIVDDFQFARAIKGKYVLLFFYPLDFTFVCPSELIALDHRMAQFRDRNVEVIAVSVDSHFTHNAWRNMEVNNGGIGKVSYTMCSDMKHHICQSYGVQSDIGVALRGSFIIDISGIVRIQQINDLPIGRNIDELLRLVDAIQFHEKHGYVCPAGWTKGDQGMDATPKGVAEYLENKASDL